MSDQDETAQQRLSVDADISAKTTFAAAQNAVPVIRQIRLRNDAEQTHENLQLQMVAQPPFCQNKTWSIDRLPAGGFVDVRDRAITFDFAVLDRLNEAEHGQLTFKLLDGETVLAEQVVPIELLARDEWGGMSEMPQILAAFVAPNHPVVSKLLKDASNLLVAGGHSGALNGYQSRDPRRAYMLAAALWAAVGQMGLTYAEPPRSFESQGQKVRDPGCMQETGLGTCLDTALLYAACCEAAGLNPVVLFTEGHALVGVWLINQSFAATMNTDVVDVRKAVAANELLVLESTLLTQRSAVDFKKALANGAMQLEDNAERPFCMALDLAKARAMGIRPLARMDRLALTGQQAAIAVGQSQSESPSESLSDSMGVESMQTDAEHLAVPAVPAVPTLPDEPGLDELPATYVEALQATPGDRLDRWQKKLLDLSLRNRLLNFSETKQTLGLVCPDVSALEDALADGRKFRVVSLKDENPLGDRDPALLREQTGRDIQMDFAAAAFEKKQVCATESGEETAKRLTTLYRKAKSDLAEGGTNTLFLAVGFLRWKKSPSDTRVYKAPLLLLPIKLTRQSAHASYHLSHHEDDVVFNQTLLEFLERDFGLAIPGLRGALPTDESGIDIPQVFAMVQRAVRESAGFEVVHDTAISTFSFAKYLMWKDLVDRSASLRENRLVRHLLENPTEPFSDGSDEPFPTPATMDAAVDPARLYTPLPADSSQLSAVVAAESGRDFVIIGPPGTGKSQTIANMIAHCLAHGKTVLFVAEKSAALDVVHRRLKAHGLGDACLELHSNKADRKSVIAQLGAAWDRQANPDDAEWIKLTDDLKVQRDALNAYVQALHQPGSHGRSVFHAMGVLLDAGIVLSPSAAASASDAPMPKRPLFAVAFDAIDTHDQTAFDAMLALIDRLALIHPTVAGCDALMPIEQTEWSFGWERELLDAAKTWQAESQAMAEACQKLAGLLLLKPDASVAMPRVAALLAFVEAVDGLKQQDHRFALTADLKAIGAGLDALAQLIEQHLNAQRQLVATYDAKQIERMPLVDLDRSWREACVKFAPLAFFAKRKVQKLMQSHATSGTADPEKELAPLMDMQQAMAAVADNAASVLPGFDGLATDVSALRDLLHRAAACKQAVQGVLAFAEAMAPTQAVVQTMLDSQQAGSVLTEACHGVSYANSRFDVAKAAALNTMGGRFEPESLQSLSEQLQAMQAQASSLNDWVKWVAVRQEAQACGLQPVVDALQNGLIASSGTSGTSGGDASRDPKTAFEVAYFDWWLPQAIDREPMLRGFVHWEHNDRVDRFKTLVQAVQNLAAEQVKRAVSHNLPARDEVARNSELGVLRHQLGLQRPSASIRTLIEKMPEAFTQLAPCVLMSPLSVAQYLPAEQRTYDMVIFDEASQITTWDAIGAIARGRQSIIVGDPKQLPPTNFFGRTNDEEEQDLALHERDLPSILDEAEAAGLKTHQLNWHYRSRDEGLIAFSNRHYYGQRLVTFPSPNTDAATVVFHKVEGIYARGEGRVNTIEAQAVVAFVIERLESWAVLPEAERLSIGVITFNAQQQELILDLLDEAQRQRPHLDWFFSDDREEKVMVKNLENVQGDERDVMVFSITFGPDKDGKLSMDFGAVNREGGEKRLNVAVTRAKSEFHVFSCIHAEDIDTRRAKGLGVAHLKRYLDYAQRGAAALSVSDPIDSLSPEAAKRSEQPLEQAVADALAGRGWVIRQQVGVSEFKIDLAIVHPDQPDVYLAGIECDGPTYQRSATARDRDQIREGVLTNLGWQIVRVWSTDWFIRPAEALERLDETLKGLLEKSRAVMPKIQVPDAMEPSASADNLD